MSVHSDLICSADSATYRLALCRLAGGGALHPCYLHELDFLSLVVKCAPENSWGESSPWDTNNRGSAVGLRCKKYLLLTLVF